MYVNLEHATKRNVQKDNGSYLNNKISIILLKIHIFSSIPFTLLLNLSIEVFIGFYFSVLKFSFDSSPSSISFANFIVPC